MKKKKNTSFMASRIYRALEHLKPVRIILFPSDDGICPLAVFGLHGPQAARKASSRLDFSRESVECMWGRASDPGQN